MFGRGSVPILEALPIPLGSTPTLFIPPAFAGPRAIPLIGTFPVAAEPAGRANPPIAAEPACPPRANEAAGGVKTMNNAIATFTEGLDIRSASMIRSERRSREAHIGSQSADTIKLNFRFRCPGAVHEVKGQGPDHESACQPSTSWKETNRCQRRGRQNSN